MIKVLFKFTLFLIVLLIATQLLIGCDNNSYSIIDNYSKDTENSAIADTKSESTIDTMNITDDMTENSTEEKSEVIIVDTSVPEEDSEIIIVDTATSEEESEVIIIDTATLEEETEVIIDNTYISEEDAYAIAREYWDYTDEDKAEGSTIMIYDGLIERSDGKTYHTFRMRWWVGSNWSTIDYLYIDQNTGECFNYVA